MNRNKAKPIPNLYPTTTYKEVSKQAMLSLTQLFIFNNQYFLRWLYFSNSWVRNDTLRWLMIPHFHLATVGAQVESSLFVFDQLSLIPQALNGRSIWSPSELSFSNCEQYFPNISTLTWSLKSILNKNFISNLFNSAVLTPPTFA